MGKQIKPTRRSKYRGRMRLLLLTLCCCAGVYSQGGGVNFGGSTSSGSSSSGSKNNTSNRILGLIPGISTGDSNTDSLINGGLLGAGLVAGAGILNDALNNPCGRRKRQTDVNGKIFFGSGVAATAVTKTTTLGTIISA